MAGGGLPTGSVTVGEFAPADGRMNVTFNGVTLPMNQGAGQCVLNGTIATTGFSQASSACMNWNTGASASRGGRAMKSSRSLPEVNTPGWPVISTARTLGSLLAARSASAIASYMAAVRAFFFSGRAISIVASCRICLAEIWSPDPKTGQRASLLADDVWATIHENAEVLDSAIIYDRDFSYDYFGFKTLERSYLLRLHGQVVERPQHMLMRVAVGIHKADLDSAIRTYNDLSEGWYTHATPTLFNPGTPKPQMSSCFLLQLKDDSISGIYDA